MERRISATNPAVSLPELGRIRSILASEELFVVVQDAFLTETARLADVVLPTAIWGEKTGTFTNADRTVHLSERAVDPPGEARSDLDIFLDYARRMDFRDRDGKPLIKWHDPESAFEAWKACSRRRPCGYSGLAYARLRSAGGIQWPCNDEHPNGTERLYTDLRFNTQPEVCEDYGHDLLTGAVTTQTEYRAANPAGRAILKAADYQPPHESPAEDYPLLFSTGRILYHFHTRTKTGRARQLDQAAPDVWVELSAADAFRHVGDAHAAEPDVYHLSHTLAGQCERHAERLQPFVDRYGEDAPSEPDRLHSELFTGTRSGGLGLLRDLQDLYLMVTECDMTWTMIGQAAQGTRDTDLVETVKACEGETATQLKWLKTRMKQAAPQALVVAK